VSEDSKDKPQVESRRRAHDTGGAQVEKRGYPLRRASDFGSVLVVDDDADAVEILCRMLGMQQFRAIPARSGAECLEIARAQPIDVILLDVNMPVMDGLTVCTELAREARTRSIPIILVTARDDHETRLAGMKLGVSEFLTKPVNRTELINRVRGQLEGRALARQMDRAIEES
jgi:DNA-binding response OmpR family regulator